MPLAYPAVGDSLIKERPCPATDPRSDPSTMANWSPSRICPAKGANSSRLSKRPRLTVSEYGQDVASRYLRSTREIRQLASPGAGPGRRDISLPDSPCRASPAGSRRMTVPHSTMSPDLRPGTSCPHGNRPDAEVNAPGQATIQPALVFADCRRTSSNRKSTKPSSRPPA